MAWFGGNGTLGRPTDGSDAGGASGLGRKKGPNSVVIGTAVRREDLAASQLAATAPPPSAILDASNAIGAAQSAAARQRKRAASGSMRPTSSSQTGAPRASLTPRSLIGS
jgi:hypothetical protein